MSRLVLRHARHPGDIAVVDGRIAAIGNIAASPGDQVLRCDGAIITPGLVNAHEHLFQRLARGRAVDAATWDWLAQLWSVFARMTVDDIALAAEVALAELALSGTTLVADHHYLVPYGDDSGFDQIAAAARRIGVRICIARGAVDRPPDDGGLALAPAHMVEETDACLAAMAELAGRVHDGDRVSLALAPTSLAVATPTLIAGAADLAQRLGLGLHTHLGEVRREIDACVARHRIRPLELLEEAGWLQGRAWIAHGIHLDADERQRLATTSTGTAHCPSSNARLGAGSCAVADLRARGVAVGLGADGCAANELGVLSEARLAVYIARLRDGSAAALSARDALDIATAGGARCVSRPELGRLDVGAPADLAVWPADDLQDIADAEGALVLGPDRRVRHLLVGGDIIVRDGDLQTFDLEPATAQLNARAVELWERR